MHAASFLLALVPFVLAPAVACLWLSRESESVAEERLWAVVVGVSPVLFFGLVALLLWFLPGQTPTLYVVLPFAVFAMLALVAAVHRWKQPGASVSPWRRLGTRTKASLALAAVVAVAAPLSPLVESDPLEYAQAGRIVAEARDLHKYPVIAPESGFWGGWSHGPLFATFFAWDMLVGRARDQPLAGPVAGGWFFFATALLLAVVLGRRGPLAALAPCALTGTFLFALLAASAHIETFRIFAVTAALAAAGTAAQYGGTRRALVAATAVAVALYSHSAAILLLGPLCLGLGYAYRQCMPGVRTAAFATVGGFLAWVPWAIRNTLILGSPVADTGKNSVFDHPAVQYFATLRLARGIETAWERVVYGVLSPWMLLEFFGLVAWIALAALALPASRRAILEKVKNDVVVAMLVAGPAVYFLGAALSAPLGIELFIQNARYPMTFLAGWALVAAFVVTSGRRTGFLLAGVAVASALYSTARVLRVVDIRRGNVFSAEPDRFKPRLAIRIGESALERELRTLTFRQAEWGVYGEKQYLSHFHPTMRSVYDAPTPDAVSLALHELAVGVIAVPVYYPMPFYSQTPLAELTGDPAHAEVLHADDEWAVFRLGDRRVEHDPLESTLGRIGPAQWRRHPFRARAEASYDADGTRRLVVNPRGAYPPAVVTYVDDPATWIRGSASLVEVHVSVRGRGLGGVSLVEKGPSGERELPLWKGLLGEKNRFVRAQRVLARDTTSFVLRWEVQGRGEIEARQLVALQVHRR